jgi:hypothetical protein
MSSSLARISWGVPASFRRCSKNCGSGRRLTEVPVRPPKGGHLPERKSPEGSGCPAERNCAGTSYASSAPMLCPKIAYGLAVYGVIPSRMVPANVSRESANGCLQRRPLPGSSTRHTSAPSGAAGVQFLYTEALPPA